MVCLSTLWCAKLLLVLSVSFPNGQTIGEKVDEPPDLSLGVKSDLAAGTNCVLLPDNPSAIAS